MFCWCGAVRFIGFTFCFFFKGLFVRRFCECLAPYLHKVVCVGVAQGFLPFPSIRFFLFLPSFLPSFLPFPSTLFLTSMSFHPFPSFLDLKKHTQKEPEVSTSQNEFPKLD